MSFLIKFPALLTFNDSEQSNYNIENLSYKYKQIENTFKQSRISVDFIKSLKATVQNSESAIPFYDCCSFISFELSAGVSGFFYIQLFKVDFLEHWTV